MLNLHAAVCSEWDCEPADKLSYLCKQTCRLTCSWRFAAGCCSSILSGQRASARVERRPLQFGPWRCPLQDNIGHISYGSRDVDELIIELHSDCLCYTVTSPLNTKSKSHTKDKNITWLNHKNILWQTDKQTKYSIQKSISKGDQCFY